MVNDIGSLEVIFFSLKIHLSSQKDIGKFYQRSTTGC